MSDETTPDGQDIIGWTAEIVAAHVSNNSVTVQEMPELIRTVHDSLAGLSGSPPEEKPVPKVPIRSSVRPDFIVCLEDGRKLKMLKRHLATAYGMTPQEYRKKWGLPDDYPMVAPKYAEQRSELAKRIGLGRQRRRSDVPGAIPATPPVAE